MRTTSSRERLRNDKDNADPAARARGLPRRASRSSRPTRRCSARPPATPQRSAASISRSRSTKRRSRRRAARSTPRSRCALGKLYAERIARLAFGGRPDRGEEGVARRARRYTRTATAARRTRCGGRRRERGDRARQGPAQPGPAARSRARARRLARSRAVDRRVRDARDDPLQDRSVRVGERATRARASRCSARAKAIACAARSSSGSPPMSRAPPASSRDAAGALPRRAAHVGLARRRQRAAAARSRRAQARVRRARCGSSANRQGASTSCSTRSTPSPSNAANYASAVAFLLEVGSYADALDIVHRALAQPTSASSTRSTCACGSSPRRRAAASRAIRQAAEYLASRQGDLWYELLAHAATGRLDVRALRAAATTGPRKAELAFYRRRARPRSRGATPAGARKLLEQVVDAQPRDGRRVRPRTAVPGAAMIELGRAAAPR